MDFAQKRKAVLLATFGSLLNAAMATGAVRSLILKKADKKIYELFVEINPQKRPRKVQEDKYVMTRNLLYAVDKALKNKHISPRVRKGLLKVLLGNIFLGSREGPDRFKREHGSDPPGFLTISPGAACNLHCDQCYAGNLVEARSKLDFELVSQIIADKRKYWGSFFTVISGGEPFMWKSGENGRKGVLDLAERHDDNYFLIFTNGTLIDRKTAERMAELGNVTPAISVEGFEEETDKRRGKGVFKRLLHVMENLRKVGVPFGISLTATRNNAELLLSEKFIDFYFNQQGAIYGWIFQYMPIGCKPTLDLLITPEQRLNMYFRERELVEKDKVFIADFWNSGTISDGCICAGRTGGYFYIDWHGNVMPCVFTPYSTHNIKEIYRNGGDINTILETPFFKAVRKWQTEYGYMQPSHQVCNEITPCPIRDHHRRFYNMIKEHQARLVNAEAGEALEATDFIEGLCRYGEKVSELTGDIWDKEYLEPERRRLSVAEPDPKKKSRRRASN
ncbi:MAG: radical SAM protein [Candidatus Zixiibacteriota bacterium]